MKRTNIKHPRICWAARKLGVSRAHLTAVLNGAPGRQGRPGLVEDYEKLMAKGETLPHVTRQAIAEAAGKLKGRGRAQ